MGERPWREDSLSCTCPTLGVRREGRDPLSLRSQEIGNDHRSIVKSRGKESQDDVVCGVSDFDSCSIAVNGDVILT